MSDLQEVVLRQPAWFTTLQLALSIAGGAGLMLSGFPTALLALPLIVAGSRLARAKVVATASDLSIRNFVRTYRIPSSDIARWVVLDTQLGVETKGGRTVFFDAVRSVSFRADARRARLDGALRRLVATQRLSGDEPEG